MDDAKKILTALTTVKEVASKFAAFAVVSEAADSLAALVNHEAELKKSIAEKQAEIEAQRAQQAEEAKAHKARMEAAAKEHEQYAKQYDDHSAKLRKNALDVEAESATRIEAAKKLVGDAEAKATQDIAAHKTRAEIEKQKITDAHNVFIEATKQHRAQIEEKTAALQKKLDDLREQVAPLMGDAAGATVE